MRLGKQNMPYRPNILCLSQNLLLLETRRAVLARRYDVVSIATVDEMIRLAPERPFDVVLLCHTISKEDCHYASEFARRRWPGTKILALTSDSASCVAEHPDRVVPGLDGPVALLNAIRDLIPSGRGSGISASI